nr:MAG TPA: hypothetical protein [Caudoviricetes sp.]
MSCFYIGVTLYMFFNYICICTPRFQQWTILLINICFHMLNYFP